MFITLNLILDSQRESRCSYQKSKMTTFRDHVHLSRCRVELRVVGDEDGYPGNKLTATTFGNNFNLAGLTTSVTLPLGITLQHDDEVSPSIIEISCLWNFSQLSYCRLVEPQKFANLDLAVSISQIHLQVASSTFGYNLTLQASHLLLYRSFILQKNNKIHRASLVSCLWKSS